MSWLVHLVGNLVGAAHTAGWFSKLPQAKRADDSERECRLLILLSLRELSPTDLWTAHDALCDTTAHIAIGRKMLAPESHKTVPHAIEMTRQLVDEGMVTVHYGTPAWTAEDWRAHRVTGADLDAVYRNHDLWSWPLLEDGTPDYDRIPPQRYVLVITDEGDAAYRNELSKSFEALGPPPSGQQPAGDFAAWIDAGEHQVEDSADT